PAIPCIRLFFLLLPRPPSSTLFPYTTLFRSQRRALIGRRALYFAANRSGLLHRCHSAIEVGLQTFKLLLLLFLFFDGFLCCGTLDRKSTRLNSSHVAISYAVFCLKKKIK